ncbi:MAG TPA: HEAT repeat domain-containing protein [Edaphobacter sp.]|nr:HEAT repeat domain-containing protein [Edaphobacter sp.]
MTTTITIAIIKRIGSKLLSPALLLVFAAAPLHAMAFEPAPLPTAAASDNSPYATGTRAMNEHRWPDAIRAFDKVIAAKEKRSDAALYWKAYSLNKLQRHSDSTAICNTLHAQYPDSSWNKDCDVLSISNPDINIQLNDKVTQNVDVHVHPDVHIDSIVIPNINVDIKNNPDIKILALNSMLNQDPAKAIPVLRDILNGNQSLGVKKHAIFVLAQSKSPEAQAMLHDLVTGKKDPELQRQAIMMMALFQGKRDDGTLAELYHTTPDRQLKRSIISAFFITQDAPHLVDLARSEKDMELKRTIVSQLAVMHDKAATDYMMELLK